MLLTGVRTALEGEERVDELLQAAAAGNRPELAVSAVPGVRPALLAAASVHRPALAVTATTRAAEDLVGDLRSYLPAEAVAVFPSWETLPHERLSPRSDTVGARLSVIHRLTHPDQHPDTAQLQVVVAPVRAVLQPLARGLSELTPVVLRPGVQADLDEVVDALVRNAYTRTDMVERRGEFAVRGGILDVFPAHGADHPLRVEFFGDDVDEVRSFSVADQRSLDLQPRGVWAPPCREILLTKEVRTRAENLKEQLPGAADLLDKIAAGIAVEGMESLAPALVDGMQPLTDLIAAEAMVVVLDPERVTGRAHDLVATSEEFLEAAWANTTAGNSAPVDLSSASFYSLAQVRAMARGNGQAWWTISPFAVDEELVEGDRDIVLGARPVRTYGGDVPAALEDLRAQVRDGLACVVTTQGPGPAERMVEQLRAADVPAAGVHELPQIPPRGVVQVLAAPASAGFVDESLGLALVTEADLLGRAAVTASTRDMRKMPSRRRNQVDPLQLHPGDPVVHEQHGVGRFVEMTQRTMGGAAREYLVLEYAPSKRGQPGDRLYVPTDALHQVTKYVGGEAPTLNKLGGSDWAKTKSRARKHVRQIAGELIRLYSARMATQGHAFGPDTPWQRELEDAFAFVETPDQLITIDEVKADMAKPVPMDRLVCGDVGYGKTEIAVRAAFKAVQDGKQVAVLVPTTLLVQQHYETFGERFASFPVNVRALSRFQTDAQAEQVIQGLADGSIDVVIGTHRLLTGRVRIPKLGLVIVDEEQRFGVEHKETLKQLRTAVDVLAMSATPIPRTLEMAVTGIREMSTLATPPEERHPVLTFVGGYDNKQVAAAIRRELLREGQVFYIHNRVSSIDRAAGRLRELVPEARIATAHGKMSEQRLEQVIVDFWEKRFDVLVCTTIVETGLDISNANTLIVEQA
ncbi:MAG: transcription-repair coupling factor, partial [Micrococcales bacterium]